VLQKVIVLAGKIPVKEKFLKEVLGVLGMGENLIRG